MGPEMSGYTCGATTRGRFPAMICSNAPRKGKKKKNLQPQLAGAHTRAPERPRAWSHQPRLGRTPAELELSARSSLAIESVARPAGPAALAERPHQEATEVRFGGREQR